MEIAKLKLVKQLQEKIEELEEENETLQEKIKELEEENEKLKEKLKKRKGNKVQ